MQKYNKKSWYLAIVIIIVVAVFQFSNYIIDERSEYVIEFRQVYGDISIRKDRDNILSLAFIVKNANSKFDDYLSQQRLMNNISLDNKEIKISQFSIVESMNYKNNSYYFLNMKLEPSEEFSDIVRVNTISLGEDTYDIGKLTFKPVINDVGDLKIESVKAFSLGMGISDFSASVKNINTYEQVKVLNVNCDRMAELEPEIALGTQNDVAFKGYEVFVIEPNETVGLIIRFNKQSAPSDVVYYISPIIQYKDGTGTHSLYFDYYSAGLNVSMNEFISIVSE